VIGGARALQQHEIAGTKRERAARRLDRPEHGPRHLCAAPEAVGTFPDEDELVDNIGCRSGELRVRAARPARMIRDPADDGDLA
jgi:hypothetical protein